MNRIARCSTTASVVIISRRRDHLNFIVSAYDGCPMYNTNSQKMVHTLCANF